MRSPWIDLRKEEHPRLIARAVSPAKEDGRGEILLDGSSISNESGRSPTSGEPCRRLICGEDSEGEGVHSKHVYNPPFGSCCVLGWRSAGETSAGSLHEASGPFLTRVRELAYGFISSLFVSSAYKFQKKTNEKRTTLKMDPPQQPSATSAL